MCVLPIRCCRLHLSQLLCDFFVFSLYFLFFRLYLSQLLCGACEKQTQFKVSAWDLDVPDEPADEHFTARQPMFQVYIGEREHIL
jgi:hypothetical protein